MKICLLNDSFPPMIDGVANTVLNYARVLTDTEGTEAIVATPRYPDTDYDVYPYKVVPYKSFDISTFVYGYRAGNPLATEALEELTAYQPDIIHTHCPVSSTVLARIVRNETGAPIVFTYHSKFDEDIANAVKGKVLRKAGARLLVANIAACDEIWTVSRGAGENLRSLGYEGDYRVVVNGVDFPKGAVSPEKVRDAVRDYDLPDGVPMFLFVGRIMIYKGLPLIIDALKILSDEGLDFRMVFIGGGPDADVIKEKAKGTALPVDSREENGTLTAAAGESGKPGKFIFTGPIRDRELLRAWNTRADLFLFPSDYDTNGIVVREAAACGLGSVLLRGSCAAEDVTDGRNGFLIDNSAESMAQALREVCRHPDKARQVGENAMNEIYISWDDSIRRAIGYYGEILEKKKDGLFVPRKRVLSDRGIEAAARLDEAGRAISSVSQAVRAKPRALARSTKQTTKALIEKQKAAYEEMMKKPRALYEGMQENVSDFLYDIKGGFFELNDDIYRDDDDEDDI